MVLCEGNPNPIYVSGFRINPRVLFGSTGRGISMVLCEGNPNPIHMYLILESTLMFFLVPQVVGLRWCCSRDFCEG